jgi:hypothetical protein
MMMLLSIVAQVLVIWTGLATVSAFCLGAALGALSAVPAPAPIPCWIPAPELACRESAERVGCGIGW